MPFVASQAATTHHPLLAPWVPPVLGSLLESYPPSPITNTASREVVIPFPPSPAKVSFFCFSLYHRCTHPSALNRRRLFFSLSFNHHLHALYRRNSFDSALFSPHENSPILAISRRKPQISQDVLQSLHRRPCCLCASCGRLHQAYW